MKYFKIIMGYGFIGKLETALVAIGAEIIAAGPAANATQVQVLAQFPATIATQRKVAQYLWTQFPGAQVTVQQASNECGGVHAAVAK